MLDHPLLDSLLPTGSLFPPGSFLSAKAPLLLAQPFDGLDGFLGTRAPLMMDVVFVALFAIVPVMGWSIWRVRRRAPDDLQTLALHKKVQLALGVVLLVAVVLFELDVRFFSNWRQRAAASPYFSAEEWSLVWTSLLIHLCFAIPTTLLWVYVIVSALRRFDSPPRPSAYSKQHRITGRLAAIGMTMTALTGWLFYLLAFAAR